MKKIVLFIVSSLFVGASAMAEGPCHSDMEKFCKDVEHGGGAVMKCMKEHEAELSTECKSHRDMMKEHMKDVHEACKADAEKFCKDVKPGKGRMKKCMKSHKKELSQACKDSRKNKRK